MNRVKSTIAQKQQADVVLTVIHSIGTWLPLTENWLYNQCRYLPDSVRACVVCDKTENLEHYSLPGLYKLPQVSRTRFLFKYGLATLSLRRQPAYVTWVARQTRAVILHSHFGPEGWGNLRAARKARLKHVVAFYGFDVNRLPQQEPRWIHRYGELFAEVDRILCEGPHMAECIRALGCPPQKITVHHLGVETDKIVFKPRKWVKYKEPLRVLIAASFREKKGIPCALDALGKLQELVPLEVTIIGDSNNTPRDRKEKCRILKSIRRNNLKSRVRLLGYQPHEVLCKETYKHHIFLSPSVTASDGDTEGGAPVSIIEMLASGIPVVSTTHCDIPEVIRHRETGLLAGEGDVSGIVKNLEWLVQNPEKWATMATNARRLVEAEFDVKKQGEKLASIYREIVRD